MCDFQRLAPVLQYKYKMKELFYNLKFTFIIGFKK